MTAQPESRPVERDAFGRKLLRLMAFGGRRRTQSGPAGRERPRELVQVTEPPVPMLDVAVIIVSWNVRDYLADCLRSVYADLARARLRGEVWVVDNGSTDGTQAFVETIFPQAHLIANDVNAGFGAGNNQGMAAARRCEPRYYFLLNPDTLIRPGAIGQLVRWLDNNPQAGMAGARLVFGNGRFQHSAFAFPGLTQLLFEFLPVPGRFYDTSLNGRYPRRLYHMDHPPFPVDHPLGAAMMVRRDVAEATRGFDESFHMYCEEIDWCWRIREAGWGIFTVPSAEIVHFGGESTSQIPAQSIVNLWQSRARFYNKHHSPFKRRLARRIVRLGLSYKAVRARTPDMKLAYRQAAAEWS